MSICRCGGLLILLAFVEPASGAAPPAYRWDFHGDPLPAGAVARLGSVPWASYRPTSELAFSPDSRWLAGRIDSKLHVWRFPSGRLAHILSDFPGKPTLAECAFLPDGRPMFPVASKSVSVEWVWPWPIRQVVFTRDGGQAVLAANGEDLLLYLAAPNSGKIRSLPIERCLWASLSPDGRFLVTTEGSLHDEWLTIQEVASPGRRRLLSLNAEGRTVFSFTADGRTLVLIEDGKATFRDLATGRCLRTVRLPGLVLGQDSPCLSPDGKTLAHPGENALLLWDAMTGRRLPSEPGPFRKVESIVFSRDGQSVVAVTERDGVHRGDLATGRLATLVPGASRDQDENVRWMLGPHGAHALRATPRGMALFDLRTGKEIHHFPGAAANAVAFSDDGRHIALARPDRKVGLWNLATGRFTSLIDCCGRTKSLDWMVFTPDGKRLAMGDGADRIHLWDLPAGTFRRTLRPLPPEETENAGGISGAGPLRGQSSIQICNGECLVSPAGDRLYESAEGDLRVWNLLIDPFAPAPFLPFEPAADDSGPGGPGEQNLLRGGVPSEPSTAVSGPVALSPDGRLLICAAAEGQLCLYETASGKIVRRIERAGLAAAFSPDGRCFAAVHAEAGTILIWDVRSLVLKDDSSASPASAEALWTTLANRDALRAYRAAWRLTAVPGVEAFLARRLHPVAPMAAGRRDALMADLASDHFATRQKASRTIKDLGESSRPVFQHGLTATTDLEVRRRLERLVVPLLWNAPDRLREARAIMVLEMQGTPEARRLLRRLAGGARSLLTREAGAALSRLEKKRR